MALGRTTVSGVGRDCTTTTDEWPDAGAAEALSGRGAPGSAAPDRCRVSSLRRIEQRVRASEENRPL